MRALRPFQQGCLCYRAALDNSESWKAMVPVCALLVSHAIPMSSADWSSGAVSPTLEQRFQRLRLNLGVH